MIRTLPLDTLTAVTSMKQLYSRLACLPLKLDQIPSGCWVACIAGITHLSHVELAAFVPKDLKELLLRIAAEDCEEHKEKLETEMRVKWNEYHNGVNLYLRQHGWRLAYLGPDCPSGYAMAYGPGPRGVDHAVIVYDGQLWHDPHESRAGLVEVTAYETLIPLWSSPEMR